MTAGEHHGLVIEAELTVDLPESSIELRSEADTLSVEAPSFAALAELRSTADGEAVAWLRRQSAKSPLSLATPVIVRVRGVPVGRYEPATPPGWIADRLDIPLRVDLSGVLRAVLRRLRD